MQASNTHPGKVLMVEVGTDEHDRSAQALAAGLRDGGLEVVFTGRFADAGALARSALEEDVDLIVLFAPGAGPSPIADIAAALDRAGLRHIGLVAAGSGEQTAPGLAAVIGAGPPEGDTLEKLRKLAAQSRAGSGGLHK